MAGKKGMKHKEKVMYDPYNFAKVAEKFKADQQKEKAEGGGEPEDQQWEFDPTVNKPDLKLMSG